MLLFLGESLLPFQPGGQGLPVSGRGGAGGGGLCLTDRSGQLCNLLLPCRPAALLLPLLGQLPGPSLDLAALQRRKRRRYLLLGSGIQGKAAHLGQRLRRAAEPPCLLELHEQLRQNEVYAVKMVGALRLLVQKAGLPAEGQQALQGPGGGCVGFGCQQLQQHRHGLVVRAGVVGHRFSSLCKWVDEQRLCPARNAERTGTIFVHDTTKGTVGEEGGAGQKKDFFDRIRRGRIGPPVNMFPALISLAFFLAAAILINLVNVHRHFDLRQIMIDISNCNDMHRSALHHATRKKATISFGVCSA